MGTSRKTSPIGPGGTKIGGSNGASCTASKPRIDTAAMVKISSVANCGRGLSRCTAAIAMGNEREQQDGHPLRHHGSIVAQHHAVFASSADSQHHIEHRPLDDSILCGDGLRHLSQKCIEGRVYLCGPFLDCEPRPFIVDYGADIPANRGAQSSIIGPASGTETVKRE